MTEPGKTTARPGLGALDVEDLPPLLADCARTARSAEDAQRYRDTEQERRDLAIVEAKKAGYSYTQIKTALRRGDGHATESMVRAALLKYA